MRSLWSSIGPTIDSRRIREFELLHGVELPVEYGAFLINIANGGFPPQPFGFRVPDLEPGIFAWHGLYGIDHPNPCYDLGYSILTDAHNLGSAALAVGFDDLNGAIVIRTDIEPIGAVDYHPLELKSTLLPESLFRIAASFDEFLARLELYSVY